jgi:hypothetical protein
MGDMGVYLGIFVISFATLALEVTLTRLLSVTTWYHLAFFAISTAMLGMTAGATTVYLKPGWFSDEKLRGSVARACLGYATVVPITLLVLCLVPVDLEHSSMAYYALFIISIASMLPFYFSGIAITAVITKFKLPIGKLYASDLVGASAGCLFVLGGLEMFDAPSLILLCGCVGVVAAYSFAGFDRSSGLRVPALSILGILVGLVILTAVTPHGIRPLIVKGTVSQPKDLIYEKWNSFSRITVYKKSVGRPPDWRTSQLAPEDIKIEKHRMLIDGGAATVLRKFETLEDIDHLRYDVTNVAYYLRPRGGAFIIGFGAGKDIQSAVLFGHERIVGVDVNPVFRELLTGRFREFAGIADRKEVSLVVDEARSFLSRHRDKYSIVQMSMIDTWAATGAGAFSLSENGLYTMEAWKDMIGHLSDDGIFTVSRWYNPLDLGETGRVLSLAMATLLDLGTDKPASHIAMVTAKRIATLLISREPFSDSDIVALEKACSDLRFRILMRPGRRPDHHNLYKIARVGSMEDLRAAISDMPLNYTPPTDENPYFFNMLKVNQAIPAFLSTRSGRFGKNPGVARGNLIATRTLAGLIVCLAVLSLVTIVFPLALRARWGGGSVRPVAILWSGAAYFALIGAGFMFVEIAMIQRLSVFLGHPVYALGILLFSIIASAGLGSLASERLPLTRRPWIFLYPAIIAAAIMVIRFVLPVVSSAAMSASMATKIVISIVAVAPMGFLLGLAFPTGMRLVRASKAAETPWYWALNGVFGVLCSAITVFVSIYFGIATSLYISAACYVCVLFFLPGMRRSGETLRAQTD